VREFKDKQKWIVGPAWPYVHAVPHIGNFLCLLAADVFTRFFRLRGDDVIIVSGSDEHGARMEFEAQKLGTTPKEIVDKNHKVVVECLRKFNTCFDELGVYTRTTSENHKQFIQNFYKKVHTNGFLFEQEETLPFCPKCDKFLPDRFVEGKCPHCNYEDAKGNQCESCGRILNPIDLIDAKCAACGTKPEARKSKHFYFDLPKFEDELKEYINKQTDWSSRVKNFTMSWLDAGLKPKPITRDIKWGIPAPFPNSEGKTFYVWSEAVLGYISATKEVAEKRGDSELFDSFWRDPKTKLLFCHGKDNIPFHTILFPALISAAKENYVFPWQVYANEFINFDGKKFSKTRGIGVWADELFQLLENPDYWRYYLFSIFPETKDTDFRWHDLEASVNNELIGNFANFVHRTLTLIENYFDGVVPEGESKPEDENLVKDADQIVDKVEELMLNLKLRDALKTTMELSIKGNEYLQKKQPWKDENTKPCIYYCVNVCRTLAILIEPFLPSTSERLWKLLNLEGSVHEQSLDSAKDSRIKAGHKINKPEILFEKIDSKELEEKLNVIRKG